MTKRTHVPPSSLALWLWSALAAAAVAPSAWAAEPPPAGETAITCTNPASGATWQIRIDYARATVDANPARISDSEITWKGKDLGNYALDRKSGKLTVIVASSTGGYFINDTCELKGSG